MDEETTRMDEYLSTNVVSRMFHPFPRVKTQTRSICKSGEAFATELDVSVAMAKGSGSADVDPSAFVGKGAIEKATGFNPGVIVLIVVVGALLIFGVGNYFLYQYAQKNLPPKKKKPVSKKKLKKEKLKGGVRPAGD